MLLTVSYSQKERKLDFSDTRSEKCGFNMRHSKLGACSNLVEISTEFLVAEGCFLVSNTGRDGIASAKSSRDEALKMIS